MTSQIITTFSAGLATASTQPDAVRPLPLIVRLAHQIAVKAWSAVAAA